MVTGVDDYSILLRCGPPAFERSQRGWTLIAHRGSLHIKHSLFWRTSPLSHWCFPRPPHKESPWLWGGPAWDSPLSQDVSGWYRVVSSLLTIFMCQTQCSPQVSSPGWMLLKLPLYKWENEATGSASGRAGICTLIFLAPKVLRVPSQGTHLIPSISPAYLNLGYQDRSGHGWPVSVRPIIITNKEQEIINWGPNVPRQLAPAHRGRQAAPLFWESSWAQKSSLRVYGGWHRDADVLSSNRLCRKTQWKNPAWILSGLALLIRNRGLRVWSLGF